MSFEQIVSITTFFESSTPFSGSLGMKSTFVDFVCMKSTGFDKNLAAASLMLFDTESSGKAAANILFDKSEVESAGTIRSTFAVE